MCLTVRLLFSSLSLTKKMSNSICLVLAMKNMIMRQKAIVLRLSHRIWGVANGTFYSVSVESIQGTSVVVFPSLLYYASVLYWLAKVCFFEHLKIRLSPKNIHEPDVDLVIRIRSLISITVCSKSHRTGNTSFLQKQSMTN